MAENAGVYTSIENLVALRQLGHELELSATRPSRAMMNGASRTRFRGRGMEFAEVRPYQNGDDIRTIDWRVTARTQKPYTKLFQEERERPIFILLDQRSTMFFGSQHSFKSVYAAQLAAALGWAAQANRDRLGALVFSDDDQGDLRAGQGKNAIMALLKTVSEFNHKLTSPIPSGPVISLYDMLAEAKRIARPGSAVFVISDMQGLSEDICEPLSQLSKHCDVTLFHVYDALEKKFPTQGLINLAGKDRQLRVDAKHINQQFNAQFLKQQKQLANYCLQSQVTAIDAATQSGPETLLRSLFAKKQRKGRAHHLNLSTHQIG